jgi:hypothetical protein
MWGADRAVHAMLCVPSVVVNNKGFALNASFL